MNDHQTTAQVARDLFYIHENRVDAYRQLLQETVEVGLDLRAIIERMIEQNVSDRQELKKYMAEDVNAPGEIYKAWQMMINPVIQSDKKTVLNTLADDELIMTNTYSLALSMLTDKEFIQLLESQQAELKRLHTHIREYHDAQ